MRFYISFFALLIITITSAAQTADNGLTATSGNIQLGGTLNKTTSIDQNNFGLHLWSYNNQIFTTLPNGNVGIGTTTPLARLSFLDVHLTEEPIGIGWYNGGYGGDATRYGIHRTAGPWIGPDYAQLRVGWNTGIILDPGSQYGKSYVDIKGNGLRVTEGNVGIGTTTPGALLSLGGSVGNAKLAIWEGTSNGQSGRHGLGIGSGQFRFFVPSSDNRFSFLSDEAGTNEVMTVLGAGNVGIGTTTPQSKLHVAGDAWVVNKLKIGDFTTGDVTDASIYTNGQVRASGGFNLRTPTSLDQIFSGMNFYGNGVGIFCNNGPAATFFSVGGANNGSDFTVGGYYNSGQGATGLVSSINVSPNVLPNGNSIEYRMINIIPQINSFNNSTGKISGIYIAPYNPSQLPFTAIETTGGSVLFNGGKVGIGTTNPQSDFHTTGTVRFAGLTNDNAKDRIIVSDADGNLAYRDASTLGGGSSTNDWTVGGNAVTGIGSLGTNSQSALQIITNGAPRMLIDDIGNIGIGTDKTANYKLSVEGTIRTRKVRVDPAIWADYVFESDYKLRPLKEVEQYVQQNKHLPEVPSAAEVKKEGLDVGDNQVILLKKIEELTLYVIEQNKRNEEQQKLLQQMQQQIDELKKAKNK